MKHVLSVGIMVIAVVAAGFIFARSGLSNPTPPSASPGIVVNSTSSAPSLMTDSQIAAILKAWTYPGAKDRSKKFVLPSTKLDSQAKDWPKYVRHFTINASTAEVERFYSLKVGINPPVGAGFKGVPVQVSDETSYVSDLVTALSNVKPQPKEAGNFTLSANDYLMNAIYVSRAHRTDITLLLIPGNAPAAMAIVPSAIR